MRNFAWLKTFQQDGERTSTSKKDFTLRRTKERFVNYENVQISGIYLLHFVNTANARNANFYPFPLRLNFHPTSSQTLHLLLIRPIFLTTTHICRILSNRLSFLPSVRKQWVCLCEIRILQQRLPRILISHATE